MKTNYNTIVILTIAVFFFINPTKTVASKIDSTKFKKNISISYWGTIDNNIGIKAGINKVQLQTSKYTIYSTLSLIANRKMDVYTSAGIELSNSLRKTGKRGLFYEHGINFGYLGSFYDFDMYALNSDDKIVNIGRKWLNSIILGYSYSIGYDFTKKTNTNLQLFVKPGIYFRYPNNDNVFFMYNYSVEIGFTFLPKWLN